MDFRIGLTIVTEKGYYENKTINQLYKEVSNALKETHKQEYQNVSFSAEQCEMFADILSRDPIDWMGLSKIAKSMQQKSPLTIKQLSELIELPRRVGKRDPHTNTLTFEVEEAQANRKAVERMVERMAYMSLIYLTNETPFKRIHLTKRGLQVFRTLINRKAKNDN